MKSYPYFVRKFCLIFLAPDFTHAWLKKLFAIMQKIDKDPIVFMERIRQLKVKVRRAMSVKNCKKIAATRFISVMSDRGIA